MAAVEQMKKIVPLVTCEIPFSQHVCELVFGVNVIDLDFGVQIDFITQPIKSNSVDSGNMSHCQASSFYDQRQQSFLTRRIGRLRESNQHCPDHVSFHEISFACEVCEVLHEPHSSSCKGFYVLDCSDTCFSVKNDDQIP